MKALLLCLGLGAVVGGTAGFVAFDDAVASPGETCPPWPECPQMACAACPPSRRVEADAPTAEAATLAAEIASLEERVLAERLVAEGKRREPPADLDPRFSASGLSAVMSQAAADAKLDFSLEAVECAEYPCIVYGWLPRGATVSALTARAKVLLPELGKQRTQAWGGDGQRTRYVFTFEPRGTSRDPDTDRRLQWRLERRLGALP